MAANKAAQTARQRKSIAATVSDTSNLARRHDDYETPDGKQQAGRAGTGTPAGDRNRSKGSGETAATVFATNRQAATMPCQTTGVHGVRENAGRNSNMANSR